MRTFRVLLFKRGDCADELNGDDLLGVDVVTCVEGDFRSTVGLDVHGASHGRCVAGVAEFC